MDKNWITAWSIAHTKVELLNAETAGKTLKATIKAAFPGSGIRIRLSNKYGSKKVGIGSVYAHVGENANAQILFSGKPEASIKPGQILLSDSSEININTGDEIAISIYYSLRAVPVSGNITGTAAHSVPGDFSMHKKFETEPYYHFPFGEETDEIPEPVTTLCAIDIYTSKDINSICAFGDSITQSGRWLNPLRDRLSEKCAGSFTLLNLGISGNRLLRDDGISENMKGLFGLAGIKRMDWDIFKQSGLKCVLVAIGINDISQPGSGPLAPDISHVCSAEGLIDGYKTIIAKCHAQNIKAIGCTITPFGGYSTFNGITEAIRQKTNRWILESGEFDKVFDFASWISDPKDASKMADEYDSGDHLHPGEYGGKKIADGIDITELFKAIEIK